MNSWIVKEAITAIRAPSFVTSLYREWYSQVLRFLFDSQYKCIHINQPFSELSAYRLFVHVIWLGSAKLPVFLVQIRCKPALHPPYCNSSSRYAHLRYLFTMFSNEPGGLKNPIQSTKYKLLPNINSKAQKAVNSLTILDSPLTPPSLSLCIRRELHGCKRGRFLPPALSFLD